MFDTRQALHDMATQIRAYRAEEGLTLQQLATQSGVAASTIHKIEAQQMVPTVSVFLKIARGLGRRPDQLIRDRALDGENVGAPPAFGAETPILAASDRGDGPRGEIGVWRINLSAQQMLPALELAPRQRALFLVEQGRISLQSGDRRVHIAAVNCIEFQGGTILSPAAQLEDARVTLIVSPPGNLEGRLGAPIGLSVDGQAQARPSGATQRPT